MKKNIRQLKQAHGKVETTNIVNTLDQIWGDTGQNGLYKTSSEEEYKKNLDEMNKSDLQTHAVKLGLIPVDNRQLLVNRLIRQFKIHWAKYSNQNGVIANKQISKTAKDILAEGV